MKKKYVISIVCLILYLLLMILVLTNNIKGFDNSIYNFIISFRSKGMDKFFKTITIFGNTIPVLIIILFILILASNKERVILCSNVVFTVLINQVIKRIVRRERPHHLRLIKETGFSFPSGHSMISMCVYGTIIYLVNKNIKNKYLRIFFTIFLILLILLVGISRIYVGVHYPSDVLAGYLLTIPIIVCSTDLVNKYFGGK